MLEWNNKLKNRLKELRQLFYLKTIKEEEKKELMCLYELEHIDYIKRFGELIDWMTKLLYDNDPMNLIQFGIPLQEYDIEAKMILNELSLLNKKNLKEIIEIVYEVFLIEFGKEAAGNIDNECYTKIAKEIVKKMGTPES
jgi:hypothetical protein